MIRLLLTQLLIVATIFANLQSAYGVEEKSKTSQFELEPRLVDKLYAKATKIEKANNADRRYELGVGVSALNAEEASLQNRYFETNHRALFAWLPAVQAQLAFSSFKGKGIEALFGTSIGYAKRTDTVSVESTIGTDLRDTITVQWLPAAATAEIRSRNPIFRPYGKVAIGQQWVSQTGHLDGINQTYAIPFASTSLGMSMGKRQFGEVNSQGVNLGATYSQSIQSEQRLSLWSIDLATGVLF